MKRFALILAILGAVTAAVVTTVTHGTVASAAGGKTPIVLVHGYTAQNLGTWTLLKPTFMAAGYGAGDLHEFNYPSTLEGAEASSRRLDSFLGRVAASSPTGKVDVVAHSEGNLVTETCFVLGGCKGKIRRWVNLSGAQNGTYLAAAAYFGGTAPGDMNPASSLVRRLNNQERAAVSSQGVKCIVFWSSTDTIIIPGSLSRESYCQNRTFIGTHFTVYADAGVLQQSLAFLR